MICSRGYAKSSLLGAGVLLLMAAQLRAQANQPASFDVLLGAFAHMPGLEARFVEDKHLALLAEPLQSSGVLFFARPGMLLRRVEAPRKSEVVITPTELRMKDADGEQSIDLR